MTPATQPGQDQEGYADWPPRSIERNSRYPLPVPYLERPPEAVTIDGGRQLFIDDYLIAHSTLRRVYHTAKPHAASPVLIPQTPLEMNQGHCPVAAPFNDGVWYDPVDGYFKLWYHAGWFDGTALAVSQDGLHWERPDFGVVPGTNAVMAPRTGYRRDGALVWLDHDAPPTERFKLFLFFRHGAGEGGEVYTSPDGIHWAGCTPTSPCGDNTSFFYNPFRRRYVFSIREGWPVRARAYFEAADFRAATTWPAGAPVAWARTDELDRPDPLVGDEPQLYDLNAVAYESILLGAHAIFYGPPNPVCAKIGKPKLIDLQMGYSRDGFHWHRPDRNAFIPCSREWGSWDYGYVHAAGGVCLVVGDELWFYYGAFSGKSPVLRPGETGAFVQDNAMYAGGATGLATLRRDGFASLEAGEEAGFVITRPLLFSGRYLFVNVDAPDGLLTAAILGEQGQEIEGFTDASCHPVSVDSTRHRLVWNGVQDLSGLAGRPVRLRFRLRQARLYSFWVSPAESAVSHGYVAAGGPGFSGSRDI